MCSRKNLYSKEATLASDSKRELDDGCEKDPIHKLRLLCFSHGDTGILKLSRTFRKMSDGENLTFDEFTKSIQANDLKCSAAEIRDMYHSFDENGSGSVNITKLLSKLRPQMPPPRLDVIDKAFAKMDSDTDGVITVKDFKSVYNVQKHPKYQNGEMTKNEILAKFLNLFENGNSADDDKMTKEEFLNYYAMISATIDNDLFFDLFMRQAYKL